LPRSLTPSSHHQNHRQISYQIIPLRSPNPAPQLSSSYQLNPDENGVYHIADGVKASTVIFTVEPDFSEAARKRKVAGDITVKFIVDVDGHPRDLKVIKSTVIPNTTSKDRAAAQSLEPKAIEAVSKYQFKPATLNGKPVPCWMTIEVNYQMF
jgi:TonB family protein